MADSRSGPLWKLIIEEERWNDEDVWGRILQHYKENPQEATNMSEEDGSLPIHWACEYGAPLDVIETIFQANEEGIRTIDNYGLLPIHCACTLSTPLEILIYLIDLYNDGIRAVTNDGKTPMHIACFGAASLETIRYLHHLHPDAVNMKDKYGRTPMERMENSSSKKSAAEKKAIRSILEHSTHDFLGRSIPWQQGTIMTKLTKLFRFKTFFFFSAIMIIFVAVILYGLTSSGFIVKARQTTVQDNNGVARTANCWLVQLCKVQTEPFPARGGLMEEQNENVLG